MYLSHERRAFQTCAAGIPLAQSYSNKADKSKEQRRAWRSSSASLCPTSRSSHSLKVPSVREDLAQGIAAGRPLVIHFYNGG